MSRLQTIFWLAFSFLFPALLTAADDNWREYTAPMSEWVMTSGAYPALFYVSLDGSDDWSGRLPEPNETRTDGPFRTFTKARDALRAYRSDPSFDGKPTVVEVRPGIYELDEPLQFGAADSGTEEAPVVWRGAPAENGTPTTVLRGGKTLSAPQPVTDPAVLARLCPEARGKVVQFDLKACGVTDFGGYEKEEEMAELFQNQKPMTIARFPNSGFQPMKRFDLEENEEFVDHNLPAVRIPKLGVDGHDISAWGDEPDAWAFGYWCTDWANSREKIVKVDTQKKTIELAPPYHKYGYRTDQYFYVYHLLSELDTPGEYYIDGQSGTLYFWPPEPIKPGSLFLTTIPTNVEGKDLKNFVFTRFLLDGCRAAALKLEGKTLLVSGCLVRNIGGGALNVLGNRCLVFGNHIYGVGAHGVKLEGGDRYSLTPAHSAAVNNDIHHYARIARVYSAGVTFNGCGILASHNRITDAPHNAILYGGNNNVIEYNEIGRVCQESNDAGAIYCGGTWTMRGNVIRYNYMHDVEGFEAKGAVGVYLDDLFSSAEITGNLFANVTAAVFVGGGRDSHVTNNIFVECNPAIRIDERGLDWQKHVVEDWLKGFKKSGTLNGIDVKSGVWAQAYPSLAAIGESANPGAPEGTLFARNVVIRNGWDQPLPAPFEGDDIYDRARPYVEVRENVIGDYRLLLSIEKDQTPELPNAKIPFDRIPTEQIGHFGHPAAVSKN